MADADDIKPAGCFTCGQRTRPFASGKARKYCDQSCARHRYSAMSPRYQAYSGICLGCGAAAYRPTGTPRKWCSIQCQSDHRVQKPWTERSRAQKDAQNAAARLRKVEVTGVCLYCAEPFSKVRSKSGRRWNKYCSKSCSSKHRVESGAMSRALASYHGPRKAKRASRFNLARLAQWADRSVRKQIAAWRTSLPNAGVKCPVCAAVFCRLDRSFIRMLCSDSCHALAKRKAKAAVRKSPSGRKRKRIERLTRSARERGYATAERFDPLDVMERDGWRCYLCGCDTPRSLRGQMVPSAPEIDHVIPLAFGGVHALGNVRCACRQCNGEKSDKPPLLTRTVTVEFIHHPA